MDILGAHVARVDEVFGRQEIALGEGVLDRQDLGDIGGRSKGGRDLSDQAGQVVIAGLRQMDLVARPMHFPLGGEPRLRLIRRLNMLTGRRRRIWVAPRIPSIRSAQIFLLPYPLQQRDLPQGTQGDGRLWPCQVDEEPSTIRAHLLRLRRPFCLAAGQAIGLNPSAVALVPVQRDMRLQPAGRFFRQRIEGGPQGLGHALKPREDSQGP